MTGLEAGDVVQVTVTFLEMLQPPAEPLPPAPPGASVEHVVAPSVEQYRQLYELVGRDWYWVDRRRMPDVALRELLEDPRVEVHVLKVDGQAAGFAELDRAEPGEVRLMYFGLAPGFIGRGLGRWFLRWAVDRAWSLGPGRVWLDTCTLDHPRALGNYEAAGFQQYGSLVKEFVIPW
jgi:GNAT superfamily N-acetyltransferase